MAHRVNRDSGVLDEAGGFVFVAGYMVIGAIGLSTGYVCGCQRARPNSTSFALTQNAVEIDIGDASAERPD